MKQRELLPLFDENADMPYLSLLDGDDTLVEYKLETKRVDPTSYSGKISHDSEDSKSVDTATACIGDDVEMPSKEAEEPSPDESAKVDGEVDESEKIEADANAVKKCSDEAVTTVVGDESESSNVCSEMEAEPSTKGKEGEGVVEGAVPRRADALESLLELCARLLKQDKFEELSGVLKPFGEDTVSSRETAIWLTKSLINAHNLPNQS